MNPTAGAPRPIRSPALRAILRNLGWLLASRGVLGVLSLFYLGFATRSLGVVDFGRFALITGAAQAITTLVGFQTWQIIVQYGVDPLQQGQNGKLARLLRCALILDIISATAGIALAAAILTFASGALGIPDALRQNTLIFAVVTLLSIRSTPLGILRLRDRFAHAALADSMTPVARFLGSLYALAFDPSIRGFLIAWGAAELATAAAYWILVARGDDLPLLRSVPAEPRRTVDENPGIVSFALSTNANATLGMSGKQIPLLLVGAMVGTSAAGAFRLSAQLAQALAKVTQLVARAAFPEVVRMAKQASPQHLGRLLPRTYLVSGLAALTIMAVVTLGGKTVLSLIGGKSYRDAYPMLLYLTAAGCLELVMISAETMLTALNRASLVFAIRTCGVAVLLGAAFVIVPEHGATGMAIAVLAGSTAVALLLGIAAARVTREAPADAA
ncbi:lipopolysaccharide biosynthesis protein [Sphingomonas sp. Tas61C01]|uniref:lipopolysaccharide biosynthesis protein n=1 Tax=Sphingomonas sp. Tas61C01 TaxID=3458297 RepID=UPI00403EC755